MPKPSRPRLRSRTTSLPRSQETFPMPDLIKSWSCADVGNWLQFIGAARFKKKFSKAKVNGEALLRMRAPQLVGIGISDPITRRRLELELDTLRAHESSEAWMAIDEEREHSQHRVSLKEPSLPPPPNMLSRDSLNALPRVAPMLSKLEENARNSFESTRSLRFSDSFLSPPALSTTSEIVNDDDDDANEITDKNVQVWIAQLMTAVEKLHSMRGVAVSENVLTPRSSPQPARLMSMFDLNSARDAPADPLLSSRPGECGSLATSLEAGSTIRRHSFVTPLENQFRGKFEEAARQRNKGSITTTPRRSKASATVFENEAGAEQQTTESPLVTRRPSRWYEVMDPREDVSASTIANQVKLDLKFKSMRRNSRIVSPPTNESESDQDDDAILDEMEQNEETPLEKPAWVIMPNNKWRLKWDIVIMLLVVYYGVVTPINMAFRSTLENFALDMTFNCLFVFDIVMNFFTAFRIERGPDKGQYEIRMKEIARAYLRRWFWIDLVASIPLDLLIRETGGSVDASFNKLARMLRGFKLIRVLRMSRIFGRLSQASQSNPAMLRLGKLFGGLIFMWHWMACFYWLISGLVGFGETRWTPKLIYEDASFGTQYAQAFFWAVMATTGVGRDIEPEQDVETVFTIIAIVVGVLIYAFIVGSASTALANLDTSDAEKRQTIEMINQFLKQREVPKHLKSKILQYYEYMWSRQLSPGNKSLLDDLHTGLKIELEMVLNRKLIKNVPMFQEVSQNCILSIISKLASKIFLPKEYVCLKGERGTEMFFIMRGRVEVLVKSDTRVILKDGDFFGERCLMSSTRRAYSVQALTHSELLVLHKSQFKHLLRQFPDFAASMQKYAMAQATLYGWRKIRHVTKLVRMVNLLGGSTNFVAMYNKLSEKKVEIEAEKSGSSTLSGLKKLATKYSSTMKPSLDSKELLTKGASKVKGFVWNPQTTRPFSKPLGLAQVLPLTPEHPHQEME